VFARALSEDPSDRFEKASTFAEGVAAAFDLPKTRPERSSALPLLNAAGGAVLAGSDMRAGRERKPRTEPMPSLPLGEKSEPPDRGKTSQSADWGEKLDPVVSEPAMRSSNEGSAAKDLPPVFVAPPAERHPPVAEDFAAPITTSSLFSADGWPEVPQSSPSKVWPLVLALVLGLSVGFAGGYGVGSREGSSAPVVPQSSSSESRG